MEDILDAVPIDKWFEMFKPGAAGEGGFIRVHMSFNEDNPSESRDPSPTKPHTPTGTSQAHGCSHNLSTGLYIKKLLYTADLAVVMICFQKPVPSRPTLFMKQFLYCLFQPQAEMQAIPANHSSDVMMICMVSASCRCQH